MNKKANILRKTLIGIDKYEIEKVPCIIIRETKKFFYVRYKTRIGHVTNRYVSKETVEIL